MKLALIGICFAFGACAGSTVSDAGNEPSEVTSEQTSAPATSAPATSAAETSAAETSVAETSSADDGSAQQSVPLSRSVPIVINATFTEQADGTFDIAVTLSSPYDSADRYADAWRVRTPDGEILGVRQLTHHHANEQPFTRSLSGVAIPDGITTVVIDGRDQQNGWGDSVTFDLPKP